MEFNIEFIDGQDTLIRLDIDGSTMHFELPVRGEVTSIGIRSTRLLTRDDVEITVPNSIMGNSKIINEAGGRHEKYRIHVKVGVAYGSDIDKVHDILLDIAKNNGDVCTSPEPRIRFRAFGDSSLDHELLCWVEKPSKHLFKWSCIWATNARLVGLC